MCGQRGACARAPAATQTGSQERAGRDDRLLVCPVPWRTICWPPCPARSTHPKKGETDGEQRRGPVELMRTVEHVALVRRWVAAGMK